MPELPEVESIVRSLDKKISGKKIYRISVLRKNILQLSQKKFSTILLQQKIQRVFRYGKYIIFELENQIPLGCAFENERKIYLSCTKKTCFSKSGIVMIKLFF